MKVINKKIIVLLMALAATAGRLDGAWGAGIEPFKVKFSGVESDGNVFLSLDSEAHLDACKSKKLFLINNNPSEQQEFLRLAIQAQVFNKKVFVKPSSCFKGTPAVTATNEIQIEN